MTDLRIPSSLVFYFESWKNKLKVLDIQVFHPTETILCMHALKGPIEIPIVSQPPYPDKWKKWREKRGGKKKKKTSLNGLLAGLGNKLS